MMFRETAQLELALERVLGKSLHQGNICLCFSADLSLWHFLNVTH